jgi:ELWxxDGT repeat protein
MTTASETRSQLATLAMTEREEKMAKQLAMFSGIDSSGDTGLWLTDGTAGGTYELTGIAGAHAGGLSPSDFTSFNGEVLFSGLDAAGNRGLWVTNGTAAGTYELTGISNANASGLFSGSNYPAFTILNGEVLFDGIDASGNPVGDTAGLWETNGTVAGTHEITGISGANSAGIFHGLMFAGLNASNQTNLWVTNAGLTSSPASAVPILGLGASLGQGPR